MVFLLKELNFLKNLKENNTKEWFAEHKDEFENYLKSPALLLVKDLGSLIAEEFPPASYDDRPHNGSLMRIYRDTRFSKDKAPYKTNIAMVFSEPGKKKMASAGFGLQMTTELVEMYSGLFGFTPEQLTRYRDAVLNEKSGTALVKAAETVLSRGKYSIDGKELKKVPRGFDADHPRSEWLKFKGLYAFGPTIDLKTAQSNKLIDNAMNFFRDTSPIFQWLIDFGVS
jgi:uncharacterized protein (TIGR02453 family)